MNLRCKLNIHSYEQTMHHMNFRMSTYKSIEWEKRNWGWFEFRECKRCKKMQYRKISTMNSTYVSKSIWLDMNKNSIKELNRYINFNKRENNLTQTI